MQLGQHWGSKAHLCQSIIDLLDRGKYLQHRKTEDAERRQHIGQPRLLQDQEAEDDQHQTAEGDGFQHKAWQFADDLVLGNGLDKGT